MGVVLRISFGGDDHQITVDPIGDIGLLTIEHPVVIFLNGMGAHSCQIAARVGLRHRHRKNDVT